MKILSAGINPTMNAKNMFYNVISQMLFYKTPVKYVNKENNYK